MLARYTFSCIFRAVLEYAPGVKMKRFATVKDILEAIKTADVQVGALGTALPPLFKPPRGAPASPLEFHPDAPLSVNTWATPVCRRTNSIVFDF